MQRRRFIPLFIATVFVVFAGCGADANKSAEPKSVDDRFAIKVGDHTVQMQLAVRAEETQRGLMFRKSMKEDEGMVFVFERPQVQSFWMRNTEIPLDIAFFDADGTLKEFYPAYPHDETPVASRGRRQFVLEMNQGWFSRAGVKPGVQMDLHALADALRARGFKPEAFGLR